MGQVKVLNKCDLARRPVWLEPHWGEEREVMRARASRTEATVRNLTLS